MGKWKLPLPYDIYFLLEGPGGYIMDIMGGHWIFLRQALVKTWYSGSWNFLPKEVDEIISFDL